MSEVDVAALRNDIAHLRSMPPEIASALLAEIEGLRERLARQDARAEALIAALREWKPPHEIYDPGTSMFTSLHTAECQRCRIDALLAPETSE